MFFDIRFVLEAFPKILGAVPLTLFISVVSMLLALVLGALLALTRIYRVPVLQRVSALYVSFTRGTPLIVQLYILYYALPLILDMAGERLGWNLSSGSVPPLVFAVAAFSISTSAYVSEAIRSAIGSVEVGQLEAAYAVGLTTVQGMKRIILPQALVVALPNFGNLFLGLLKGTSLAFMISVVEVMGVASIEAADGYKFMEAYVIVSVIYWMICFLFEKLFLWGENRLKRYRREMAV